MKLEIFKNLKVGTRIQVADYQTLSNHGNTNYTMRQNFPQMIVTISGFKDWEHKYCSIYEDGGAHAWAYDMFTDYIDDTPLIFDVQNKDYEIMTTQMEEPILVELEDTTENIQKYGNSKIFSQILTDKYIVLDNVTRRVLNKTNPHIDNALSKYKCANWRIDGLTYIKHNETPLPKGLIRINFLTGEFEEIELDGSRCKVCGNKLEPDEKHLCKSCLDDTKLSKYFEYHDYEDGYFVNEKLDPYKTPTFGCEIERDFPDYNDMDRNDAIYDILKIMQGDNFEKCDFHRENVFMADGSLRSRGLEWITFPHSFNWYVKNKDKFDTTIKLLKQKYNYCATERTGNHIHINRSFFSKDNLEDDGDFAGAKMACFVYKYWNNFVKVANRTCTDYTQKPLVTDKDSVFSVVRKTIRNKDDHSVAINLQHDDTIEIRLWAGIEDADDLLLYLDVTYALATLAKKKSLEKMQLAKWEDLMQLIKLDKSKELISKRLNKGV